MLQGTIDKPTSLKTPKAFRWSSLLLVAVGLCALLALVVATRWVTSTQVADLGSAQQMRSQGVYGEWAAGSVIVLVRHAERCDRSHAACLNDPTGITVAGSQAAEGVGAGLRQLGLGSADLLASPEVRTQQTADFMFAKPIATQQWLAQCDRDFGQAAFAHKRAGHNLVLVTHSGCIDQLERALGVAGGERSSSYASALLVTLGSNGKARILGQMNAPQWRKLEIGKGA
ncbi:histidine phosphatase family protein [Pseudomonas entomophila]|uniref:lipopolysaccharide core heptose(II)-phosphate phosphatase PmrG n=1 Tax=Pseudomonas entomophila TaxID=312306 RepID=UPI00200EBE58|nr:histidine phosphatase family protein [Pseudomonas entomophila]